MLVDLFPVHVLDLCPSQVEKCSHAAPHGDRGPQDCISMRIPHPSSHAQDKRDARNWN